MKKHLLLAFVALLASGAATAQCRLDAYSQSVLTKYRTAGSLRVKSTVAEGGRALAIIKIDNDGVKEDLEKKGVVIIRQRDDLAVVSVPMDSVTSVTQTKGMRGFSFSRSVSARLDKAHATTGVDKVQAGTDLPQAYDGTGVVVGIVDQNIDPNHIAFYDKTATENRVKRLFVVSGSSGRESVKTYDTASAISGYTTDDNSDTHGTHVGGIAAGACTDESISFIGVAPNADINFAPLKTATDAGIILAIESIIDYAASQNQPVVINLSLGENSGPHDGSTLSDEYYSKLGAQVPICVAAGNEGDLVIVAKKTLTSADNTLKVLSESYDDYGDQYGTVEFWSNDKTPFTVQPVIYNLITGKVVYEFDEMTGTSSKTLSNKSYISGYVTAVTEVDERNNRYNAYFDFNLTSISKNRYAIGFIVTGVEGQSIEAYADGYYTLFKSSTGWKDNLTANGTINSMACAQNMIAVGAYSTRNKEPYLDGTSYTVSSAKVNDIAYFSSYGTLVDGRNLPHVCAPGHSVISAYSTPYIKSQSSNLANYKRAAGKVYANGRYNFWSGMSGTSMATPYVTGVIALWLQANPKLTFSDIVEIINATSTKDSYVNQGDAVQWGAGKINAYDGLKKVLNDLSSVDRLSASKSVLVKTTGMNTYEVFAATERFTMSVYDITGKLVESRRVDGNTASLDLSARQKGIYVVRIAADNINTTQKIAVK